MAAAPDAKLLTVAIATFGREQVLIDTIRDVLRQLEPAEMELIVADQTPAHDEETTKQLQEWHEKGLLQYLRLERPSLPAARNRVLGMARAPVVLFIDDDVILPPGLLRRHLAPYRDPRIGAVAGQAYNCFDPANPSELDAPAARAGAHFPADRPAGPIDRVTGCHHSVRLSAALEVGGYDEDLAGPANTEDLDVAFRIRHAGYQIYFDPETWLIHLRAPSGGCRIPGSTAWPEWTKTAGFFVYVLRHGRNEGDFSRFLKVALRAGPLRRENVTRPWRWPMAWAGFVRGAWYGLRHRRFVSAL